MSILMLIGAIITLIIGLLSIVGGGLVAGNATDIAAMGEGEFTADDAQMVGALGVGVGIFSVIAGIFNLLVGIFGIRGSKNPAKLGPLFVICIISIILDIIGIVCGNGPAGVPSLIFAAVLCWLAYSCKKEYTGQ